MPKVGPMIVGVMPGADASASICTRAKRILMAKKSTAIGVKPETESETRAASAGAAIEQPDPLLLGVRVPLSVTVEAFKQVVEAWRGCLRELSIALKAKRAKAAAAPPAAPTETPIVNAS